jgi:hypothetical protein
LPETKLLKKLLTIGTKAKGPATMSKLVLGLTRTFLRSRELLMRREKLPMRREQGKKPPVR